ncbi:MAG: hypothetical protein AAGK78_14635, partial [Planctomycetota bacterium]
CDRQLPYDAVSKIAREDASFQDTLVDALLAGESVTDIRARIAAGGQSDRNQPGGPRKPVRPKANTRTGGGTITFDLAAHAPGARVVLHHGRSTPSLAEQRALLIAALDQLDAAAGSSSELKAA